MDRERTALNKKQEKAVKSLKEKIGKGKATDEALGELEKQQQADMATFKKNASTKVIGKKRVGTKPRKQS